MATKRVWLGSLGPHLYDDTEVVDDEDDIMTGYTREGIMVEGQVLALESPTLDPHMVRLEDKLAGDLLGNIEATRDIVLGADRSVSYARKLHVAGSLTLETGAWASIL
jgi:hypothetical protein